VVEWPAPIGLEQLRHCDVKECPHCHVLVSLGRLDLETRQLEPKGWFQEGGQVEAVWCPHCNKPLYDRLGWIEHRAEQRVFDRDHQRENGRAPAGDRTEELLGAERPAHQANGDGSGDAGADDGTGDDDEPAEEPPARRPRTRVGGG
jgi:hypothetical protein